MTTRPYELTILAYRDILSADYVSDHNLKLLVATHVARFEGQARVKSMMWDMQWDHVARPQLYQYGLLTVGPHQEGLLNDPVVRSMLFDRRMFAWDVEYISPWMIASADSIIAVIDRLLE
jgi:hypothetical protein